MRLSILSLPDPGLVIVDDQHFRELNITLDKIIIVFSVQVVPELQVHDIFCG